jgi:hypothetical protein
LCGFRAASARNTLYRTHQGRKAIYESEEKFRLLANNIPGAVYLSKNDAKYTYTSTMKLKN